MLTFVRPLIMALAFVFAFNSAAHSHNIHATMTEILWNERDGSLEVVLEMPAELLEARVSIDHGEKLSFLNDEHHGTLERAAAPLVAEHLAISRRDGPIALTYLGLEYRQDQVYIYLETSLETAPEQLEIMNSLFLDDLPGQINSIIARVGSHEAAGKITLNSDPLFFDFR